MGKKCAGGMRESDIERLPQGFIEDAISLTSPRDACRCSAVSIAFRAAAASDTVWDRFLPDDLESILPSAVQPVHSSSFPVKRDLFFFLCNSILIDGGIMSFSLDRSSGAKCYMLSASVLYIAWGDTPQYWKWISLPDSRFSEVAELLYMSWLEIRGKIETKMLSVKTTYAAYLVFKLSDRFFGLRNPPQVASVSTGLFSTSTSVCLDPPTALSHPCCTDEGEDPNNNVIDKRTPRRRDDGWMELELGVFYNDDGGDGEVNMSLMEVKSGFWKKGLIIEGIEIRPKTT